MEATRYAAVIYVFYTQSSAAGYVASAAAVNSAQQWLHAVMSLSLDVNSRALPPLLAASRLAPSAEAIDGCVHFRSAARTKSRLDELTYACHRHCFSCLLYFDNFKQTD